MHSTSKLMLQAYVCTLYCEAFGILFGDVQKIHKNLADNLYPFATVNSQAIK